MEWTSAYLHYQLERHNERWISAERVNEASRRIWTDTVGMRFNSTRVHNRLPHKKS